uniref:Uncharacterized protein n=1 Tax=Timema tahoe TaxID=61484 RepID=A0A7R9NZL5_9NEOP|nr:unnamed protein product [Timema tahoe]
MYASLSRAHVGVFAPKQPFEMSLAQSSLGKKTISLPSKSDVAPAQLDSFRMESVSRLAHLPVVEESIKTASGFYGKVKESGRIFRWTFGTAETALAKAAELTRPLASSLAEQIAYLDILLCHSLDYVEDKVPSVKLSPKELLENTKKTVLGGVGNLFQGTYGGLKSGMQSVGDSSKTVVQSGGKLAYDTAKSLVGFGLGMLPNLFAGFARKFDVAAKGIALSEPQTSKIS